MKHSCRRVLLVLSLAMFVVFTTPLEAVGQGESKLYVEKARQGDYVEAATVLNRIVGSGDHSPQVVKALYDCWIRQGKYEEAGKRFSVLAKKHPDSGAIRLAAARASRILGKTNETLIHLDHILDFEEVGTAARYEKAVVLEITGHREESQDIYQSLIQRFRAGLIRPGSDRLWVALAMEALQQFHEANDLFRSVTQTNPQNAEAFVAWGNLLAGKYSPAEALSSYEDALSVDTNMPEAHLGIARVLADYNPERSRLALSQALQVNPDFIDAHLFLAEQHIDTEQYDLAQTQISKALLINPSSSKALALMATTMFMLGDEAEFKRYVKKTLGNNPLYSDIYFILAERSVSLRLYDQAVGFAREAIKLDPHNWEASSLLGINLMRIGKEIEGKSILEEAYQGDPFNLWTVNTLRLLDSFVDFDRFETDHFRIKLHKDESQVLFPYVQDLIERAYKELSAKYDFEPNGPIILEMFPDHDDFAVRALGLPGLGALGVCFGKMIVMDSPSARKPGTFNWGSTLWHEFAHVISLQITDYKIPRWFSEGISVYEERRGMLGWGNALGADHLRAIQQDQLMPIDELNSGFVRPKNIGQVSLSYYQAGLICEYIDEQYGFRAIREMLALYKEGYDTVKVFEQALGVGLDEFDSIFFDWAGNRVKEINFSKFKARLSEGVSAFKAGNLKQAIEGLEGLVEIYPEYIEEHNPYEVLAEAYLENGDTSSAIDVLRKFTSYSDSGYSAYLKLAGLFRLTEDFEGVLGTLERALFIHPMDLELHRRLGAALLEEERYVEAAIEFKRLLALKAPDLAGIYFKLASAQYGAGELVDARWSILRCLEIAPSFEEAQRLLLKIVR